MEIEFRDFLFSRNSSVMLGDGGDRCDLLHEERMGEEIKIIGFVDLMRLF
jgi:hypothetical protein